MEEISEVIEEVGEEEAVVKTSVEGVKAMIKDVEVVEEDFEAVETFLAHVAVVEALEDFVVEEKILVRNGRLVVIEVVEWQKEKSLMNKYIFVIFNYFTLSLPCFFWFIIF